VRSASWSCGWRRRGLLHCSIAGRPERPVARAGHQMALASSVNATASRRLGSSSAAIS
jgi:hypothetical protein